MPPTPTTVPLVEEPTDLIESLGVDLSSVDLENVDLAEVKVVEELAGINPEVAEQFINVVDGDVTVEEISLLLSDSSFDQLPETAINIIVSAVNNSSEEVKEEFESRVDIFEDEAFNDYVPSGSKIDVSTRRTVVAAAAAATVAAAASSSSNGGGSSRRGK